MKNCTFVLGFRKLEMSKDAIFCLIMFSLKLQGIKYDKLDSTVHWMQIRELLQYTGNHIFFPRFIYIVLFT